MFKILVVLLSLLVVSQSTYLPPDSQYVTVPIDDTVKYLAGFAEYYLFPYVGLLATYKVESIESAKKAVVEYVYYRLNLNVFINTDDNKNYTTKCVSDVAYIQSPYNYGNNAFNLGAKCTKPIPKE